MRRPPPPPPHTPYSRSSFVLSRQMPTDEGIVLHRITMLIPLPRRNQHVKSIAYRVPTKYAPTSAAPPHTHRTPAPPLSSPARCRQRRASFLHRITMLIPLPRRNQHVKSIAYRVPTKYALTSAAPPTHTVLLFLLRHTITM